MLEVIQLMQYPWISGYINLFNLKEIVEKTVSSLGAEAQPDRGGGGHMLSTFVYENPGLLLGATAGCSSLEFVCNLCLVRLIRGHLLKQILKQYSVAPQGLAGG